MNQPASDSGDILVVDDTLENLRLLATMLGLQGYEVRPVSNGRQALQAVENSPPDLILLDISMPEMDGFEVCRRLKAREESRNIPVIFLTAYAEANDKVLAFEVGGIDYITKPFQIEEVLARVRTHIALRRARRDLETSYDRLRELEAMRDNLVHMVLHDMRTPLMVLMGNLYLVREDQAVAGSDSAVRNLESAIRSVETMKRLTNDLLDVNRLEEGKMPIKPLPCDLAVVTRDVVASLSGIDRSRVIEVETGTSVELACDAGIIRRVVENLVSNGIKHTPTGSALKVSLHSREGWAAFAVVDHGPGVPPEVREKIFEKFGTVETRHDQIYQSSGLGLAFCKLAVEAHGGRIGVESNAGGGSRFWFELPG